MKAFYGKSRGFTLYELLIVMAILSIMGTMGTVSLIGFKQRSQLSGTANILKSDLNRGKILAAKYKSYVVLQIHENFYEMFLDNGAGEATSGDWVREGKELQVAKRDLAPSLSIDSNFPGDHLRLRGSGRLRPGTIIVQSRSGKHIKLVINAVGRVRLVDGVS
mgnify:FL=1